MGRIYAYAAPVEGDRIARELDEPLCIGVGKTAAAITLTERLTRGPRPDLVVLFGVCGAYPADHLTGTSPPLATLDLCLVADDLLADDGVEMTARYASIAELGLGFIGPFTMNESWNERLSKKLGNVPTVRAATVSSGSASDARSLTLAWRTGASIETMEGGAVAAVCEKFGVPLVQIRCVSNYTGDRDRGEWQLDAAVAKLQEAVLALREP